MFFLFFVLYLFFCFLLEMLGFGVVLYFLDCLLVPALLFFLLGPLHSGLPTRSQVEGSAPEGQGSSKGGRSLVPQWFTVQ